MRKIYSACVVLVLLGLAFAGSDVWSAKIGGGGGGGIGSESDTLDTVFDRGKEIDGANSEANAILEGDGTNKIKRWWDATEGYIEKPSPLGNSLWRIWDNFEGCIKDMEGDALMLCFDPDAATKKEMYEFQNSAYYPLKSFYVSAYMLQGDGAQCPARPTVVTISNMAMPTYICTENNSARLRAMIPMRNDWDGGVIYIKPYYSQTAADTGSVALEVAAACRALGTAFNGTYGTEIDVDDAALVGSGAIEATLSAAVTPNGTCAPNDLLFFYIDVDATDNPTTAAATLNFIGADIFYSSTSLSH